MKTAKPRIVGITGGSRGIGRAITDAFLSAGDRVAIMARSIPDRTLPKNVLQVHGNVRKRRNLEYFVSQISEKLGKLDVFVNCAGFSKWRPIDQIDEQFLEDMLAINVGGTLWGCASALKTLQSGGSIINISSLAGKRGSANNSAYCASKFAVDGITQSLAKELGPRNIRVNAVCPVYVETPEILKSLAERYSPARGKPVKAYLKDFTATQTALGRLPEAKEIADLVYFLSSSKASAITGQCINIDCGVFPQ